MTTAAHGPAGCGRALRSATVGPIVVHRVCAHAAGAARHRPHAARHAGPSYWLVGALDAEWVVVRGDTTVRLRPGDLVLVDSPPSGRSHASPCSETVSIQLPSSWLASWLPDPRQALARTIDGRSSWGHLLSVFVRQLSPEVAAELPLPAGVMADQLGALLALAGRPADASASPSTNTSSMHARIVARIDQLHARPGLTAATVAAGLAMSERTLRRHLAGVGSPFLEVLTARRMASARRMLQDPRFDPLTLAEVGRRCGFADASHFTRVCRARLGATPLQLRRQR